MITYFRNKQPLVTYTIQQSFFVQNSQIDCSGYRSTELSDWHNMEDELKPLLMLWTITAFILYGHSAVYNQQFYSY
jgi:hypothetical protein